MTDVQPQDRPAKIEAQIQRIEAAMRDAGVYAEQPPHASAFESSLPFCYDSMSLLEWLQWVMFPRTRDLLKNKRPLPTVCEIHPLAEEEFKLYKQDTATLLQEILKLDKLFNIGH